MCCKPLACWSPTPNGCSRVRSVGTPVARCRSPSSRNSTSGIACPAPEPPMATEAPEEIRRTALAADSTGFAWDKRPVRIGLTSIGRSCAASRHGSRSRPRRVAIRPIVTAMHARSRSGRGGGAGVAAPADADQEGFRAISWCMRAWPTMNFGSRSTLRRSERHLSNSAGEEQVCSRDGLASAKDQVQ